MKKLFIFVLTMLLIVALAACKKDCEHVYDSSCDTVCNECEEERGITHTFADATCTTAKTCTVCGVTEGSALGHSFADATCTTAKTCTACGVTEGSALGHTYEDDGDCTTDVLCTLCGEVVVEGNGIHTPGDDDRDCTTAEYCVNCNFAITPARDHVGGTATCLGSAECEVCGMLYGDPNFDNHTSTETYVSYYDYDSHATHYSCCDAIIEYGEHNGEAKCTIYAYCTICSMAYGKLDPTNHVSTSTYCVGVDNENHEVYNACCGGLYAVEPHVANELKPANCSRPTNCTECGNEFGEKDLDNHYLDNSFKYYDNLDGTHRKIHICCDTVADEAEPHTLNYNQNDMGISIYCEDCRASQLLTILEPLDAIYNGSEYLAEVYIGSGFDVEYEITYADGKTPINAGEYTVILTVGGVSTTKSFTIAKADPEWAFPLNFTLCVGNRLRDLELPDGYSYQSMDDRVLDIYYDEYYIGTSQTVGLIYTPEDTENYNEIAGTGRFTIGYDIATLDIRLEGEYTYIGTQIIPTVVVGADSDIKTENVDYVLKCENNVEVGTATVHVLGMGEYAGKVTLTFEILPCPHENEGAMCNIGDPCDYCGTAIYNSDVHAGETENGIYTCCGAYEVPEIIDNVYQIANAGNLMWFAAYVNDGNLYASARLISDIDMKGFAWVAMGRSSDTAYMGTVNGGGYTIRNLNVSSGQSEGANASFIYYLGTEGRIENVIFDGADVFSQGHAGTNASAVVVLRNSGTLFGVTVKDSKVQLGNYEYLGGIVGLNESSGLIEKCAAINVSLVRRFGHTHAAAPIAQSNYGTIKDSFAYGCTDNARNAQNGGISSKGNGTVTNSYYYTTASVAENGATPMSEEAFALGEVAYLLGSAFGQRIGEDSYPIFGGTTVYYGFTTCNPETEPERVYSNGVVYEEKPEHTEAPANCLIGIHCSVCGYEIDGTKDQSTHVGEISAYTSLNDGTHTGLYACCNALAEPVACSGIASCSGMTCDLCGYKNDSVTDLTVHLLENIDEAGACSCGATDFAAEVGGYVFEDFNTAMDHWTDGTTFKLLKDNISYGYITIEGGKKVLDLNGYKIQRGSSGVNAFNTELSIIGKEGSMIYSEYEVAIYLSNSTVTIYEGVTVESAYEAYGLAAAIVATDGSTLILNGASVVAIKNIDAVAVYDGSTFIMNSGTLRSIGTCIDLSSGSAELNGGVIETTTSYRCYGIEINRDSSLKIKDVTFALTEKCYSICIFSSNTSPVDEIDLTEASAEEYTIHIAYASNPIPADAIKYDSDEYILTSSSNAFDGKYPGDTVITLTKAA